MSDLSGKSDLFPFLGGGVWGNMQIGLWSLGVRAQPYGMGVCGMFVTFALPLGGAICGSRAQP